MEFELTYYQGMIIKSMNIKYNPQNIFYALPGDEDSRGSKIPLSSVFQYEIQGSKFSKSKTGHLKGIFERNTSYFIVVHKNVKNSKSLGLNSNNTIFLWKGEDNLNKNKNSIEKFILTPFKEIKVQNAVSTPANANKRASAFVTPSASLIRAKSTAGYTKPKGIGLNNQKEEESEDISGIHEILTPISTGKYRISEDGSQIENIKPKISSNEALVSIRSIITADNEPHFFTLLFSGTMVIRSFEFLQYGISDEFGYVMMFQLIGVPHINQKAVEVPVSWSSLSSTGCYIILADDNIFFWMGIEFNKFNVTEYLISDEMLQKLNYIYEEEAKHIINDERTFHYILQGLETDLFTKILTKEGEFDIDMPNYESEIIYQYCIKPKNPRFYCLYERGISPQYKNYQINERRHEVENENFLFKEYYNFDQLNLLQKGIYMINNDSDIFVWIGSMVQDRELLIVLQELSSIIPNDINIHFVHENFEPEIFTLLMPEWKDRSLFLTKTTKNMMAEVKEDSDEDEGEDKSDTSSNQSQTNSEHETNKEDDEDEEFMKLIEKETKPFVRILPVELWKKIVYKIKH